MPFIKKSKLEALRHDIACRLDGERDALMAEVKLRDALMAEVKADRDDWMAAAKAHAASVTDLRHRLKAHAASVTDLRRRLKVSQYNFRQLRVDRMDTPSPECTATGAVVGDSSEGGTQIDVARRLARRLRDNPPPAEIREEIIEKLLNVLK